MAMSKNGQKKLEKNLDEKADSGRSEKRPDIKASEQEKLLAGYPGAALLVADDDKRGKAETLTALDGLGHTVDRDEAIGEFGCGILAVAATTAFPAVITFCHLAFLLFRVGARLNALHRMMSILGEPLR